MQIARLDEKTDEIKYIGKGIVDCALSTTSMNPVQNKVVTEELLNTYVYSFDSGYDEWYQKTTHIMICFLLLNKNFVTIQMETLLFIQATQKFKQKNMELLEK